MKYSVVAPLAGALALGLCFAAPITAQTASEDVEDIAARFGPRSSVLNNSLSPSGNKVAWIAARPERTELLKVYGLNSAEGMQKFISNSEKSGDVTSCEWVTDVRLICQVYGMARAADGGPRQMRDNPPRARP